MSRVYFADVYKEYEVLHRYVTRLTEKYKNTLQEDKFSNLPSTENGEEPEAEKKKLLKVRCKLVGSAKFYHDFGCCCFDNHVESWIPFFCKRVMFKVMVNKSMWFRRITNVLSKLLLPSLFQLFVQCIIVHIQKRIFFSKNKPSYF